MISGLHTRDVLGSSNDSCNLIEDCFIMVRMNTFLFAFLLFRSEVALTPELPAVDRIETISKSEKQGTLRQCETWGRKHDLPKVRATMNDRGPGETLWMNNCVFSPPKEKQ